MIIFSCHANPQGTNFSRFPHMFSPLSLREEESASGTAIFFSIHKSHTPSVFGEGTAKRICGFPRQPITTQASVPVTGNSCDRTPPFFLFFFLLKRKQVTGGGPTKNRHKSRVVASRLRGSWERRRSRRVSSSASPHRPPATS